MVTTSRYRAARAYAMGMAPCGWRGGPCLRQVRPDV